MQSYTSAQSSSEFQIQTVQRPAEVHAGKVSTSISHSQKHSTDCHGIRCCTLPFIACVLLSQTSHQQKESQQKYLTAPATGSDLCSTERVRALLMRGSTWDLSLLILEEGVLFSWFLGGAGLLICDRPLLDILDAFLDYF